MLQAEIGSARITETKSIPTRGHLMADFTLPSSDGKQLSLYDCRGHFNVVLLFAGGAQHPAEMALIKALAEHYFEISETDSEIILVLAESVARAQQVRQCLKLPFPVLADADMRIHKSVGASDVQALPAAALYITDRFLEVFAAWRTGTGEFLPDIAEVLSWLNYLDSQCPECTQIEWPIDDQCES